MIEKMCQMVRQRHLSGNLRRKNLADELARILGGAKITDTVRQNAKEMQELAAQIKK